MEPFVRHRRQVLVLASATVLLFTGCDSIWPLDGTYDPRRCVPACSAGALCVNGVCQSLDAGMPEASQDLGPEMIPKDRPSTEADAVLDITTVDAGAPEGCIPKDGPADCGIADASPEASTVDAFVPPGTWILIKAGMYSMGSPSGELCREPTTTKETRHSVTLQHDFFISATEVTQAEHAAVMGSTPAPGIPTCGLNCPMESLTWHEAVAFCNTLSTLSGLAPCFTCTVVAGSTSCTEKALYSGSQIYACPGYRLPTEAEWEYAYRAAGQTPLYVTTSTSGQITQCAKADPQVDPIAWYKNNASGTTHQVKTKLPNAWGLYDMAGSVSEWCHDWFQNDLGALPATDPINTMDLSNLVRMVRGGDWGSLARDVRAASRDAQSPAQRFSGVGFRCVRSN
jgi:formylglycine-generating enzyme